MEWTRAIVRHGDMARKKSENAMARRLRARANLSVSVLTSFVNRSIIDHDIIDLTFPVYCQFSVTLESRS